MNVERWGWYSIAVNVTLGAINLLVGTLSNSLPVAAEAVHNLIDLLTAIAVLIGLRLSSRKTREFPYGLYKLENVIAVGLSISIFVTAWEIARDALFSPAQEATVDGWMLASILVALIIPVVFSHYELQAAEKANSPALRADAREYRAHILTTGVALASLVGQRLGFAFDRAAAVVIAAAIVKTGWDLLRDGMKVLLDASLPPDALQAITEALESEPLVSQVRWVTGRNAGRFRFVEAEVTLRTGDLTRAETATRRMETAARESVPYLDRIVIHAEPVKRTQLRIAAPLEDRGGELADHFGDAPFFGLATVSLEDGIVTQQTVMANPHTREEKAKGIRIAEWLVSQKVDQVYAREKLTGKGPPYVLGSAGVDMLVTGAADFDELCETLPASMAQPQHRKE